MFPARKRCLAAKNGENSPPSEKGAKRSRFRTPPPTQLREVPKDNAFVTATNGNALSPRSSFGSGRVITPKPRRQKLSLGAHRLSSIEFHGIPSNPLQTLLISENRKRNLCESALPRVSPSSYFSQRRRRGKRTSRSFGNLRIPRMSPRQFEKAKPKTATLDEKENERIFKDWKQQMAMGFNLLIYGFGSNVELLDTFGKSDFCNDGAALAADGFKGLTGRQILERAAYMYFEEDVKEESTQNIVNRIAKDSRKLYLLINSIDSPSLRKKQDQGILAKLSLCPNVKLVASMQHVNGGLLWDTHTFAAFQFSMYAVHNCQHYFHEASDRPLLLNPTKGNKEEEENEAEMALQVLRSFVSNAQQIFVILASQKISPVPLTTPLKATAGPNPGQRKSSSAMKPSGYTFEVLFKKCKARFLVSNVSVLRSHLRDFMDHDLVRRETDDNGYEVYAVQLENESVEKVLKELSS